MNKRLTIITCAVLLCIMAVSAYAVEAQGTVYIYPGHTSNRGNQVVLDAGTIHLAAQLFADSEDGMYATLYRKSILIDEPVLDCHVTITNKKSHLTSIQNNSHTYVVIVGTDNGTNCHGKAATGIG